MLSRLPRDDDGIVNEREGEKEESKKKKKKK